MASPKQKVLDNIQTTLESISIGSAYNTNVVGVIAGKILPPSRYPAAYQQALCQIKLDTITNVADDESAGQFHEHGVLTFRILASMKNVTHETFMGFIDDIEAALARCRDREVTPTDAHRVMITRVESIGIIESDGVDELQDAVSPDIFEQMAEFTVVVHYLFIPESLSGTAI